VSKARSSLANSVLFAASIQYSGLTPIGSRATSPFPLVVTIASANIPLSSTTDAGPSRITRCSAVSESDRVCKVLGVSVTLRSSWL
jgi:hypothetical protein